MSKPSKLPDLKDLNVRLSYCPDTGVFYRLSFNCGRAANAESVGYVNGNGYLIISIKNKKFRAHRLAWVMHYGVEPSKFIDHIDGNKLNNRISNLRLATKSQNMMNRPEQINNKLGLKGVHFDKASNKFVAQICRDGKRVFLGRFSIKGEAASAYETAAENLHLEFMHGGSHGV